MRTKHGMTGTRFYEIWKNMKKRCYNETREDFKNYGGRGIEVCERWQQFINFKIDMYESYLSHVEEYGEKQTTLERMNVNENYSPYNCCWATHKEQVLNKTNVDVIEFENKLYSLTSFSSTFNLNQKKVKKLIQSGEGLENIILMAKKKKINRDYSKGTKKHIYKIDGKEMNLKEISSFYGIGYSTLRGRINKGLSISEALAIPVMTRGGNRRVFNFKNIKAGD